MPLARVIDYLNTNHALFSPQTRLGQRSSYRLEGNEPIAHIGVLRVTSHRTQLLASGSGELSAVRARPRVQLPGGRETDPESLYLHAWDADEVIFLDRFLRTLHALAHLSQGQASDTPLVIDVHHRHIDAVPDRHGEIFETLLTRLGLTQAQVVLRLAGESLLRDGHARKAATSFAARGYRLLAAGLPLTRLDWDRLQNIGVHWVSPERSVDRAAADYQQWGAAARKHGLLVLLENGQPRPAPDTDRLLGAHLIESTCLRQAAVAAGP